MPTLADIKREKARYEENFEPNHNTPWGVIVEVEGSTSPPNRPNMTWVDMYKRSNGRLAVINDTTIKTAGTPVQLGPAPKPPYLAVVGTYNDSLHPTDSTTNLGQFNTALHAPNHQYTSESNKGADAVLVYQPALQPLKLTSATGLVCRVESLIYLIDGTRKVFPGANINLTSYVPSTAGQTRRVLVYLDKTTNNLAVELGTAVSGAIPIPYPVAPETAIPSGYAKLTNGQATISNSAHIEDARGFLTGNGATSPYKASADGQIIIAEDGEFKVRLPLVDQYGLILTNSEGQIITT
jgi:hypothetical protein